MPYVDGFLLAVPKRKLQAYVDISKKAGKIWKEHGALEYRECAGDDLKIKMGVPFPKVAKAKPGETVVFSWIVYKSRKHRDSVNAKVMKDPRLQVDDGSEEDAVRHEAHVDGRLRGRGRSLTVAACT